MKPRRLLILRQTPAEHGPPRSAGQCVPGRWEAGSPWGRRFRHQLCWEPWRQRLEDHMRSAGKIWNAFRESQSLNQYRTPISDIPQVQEMMSIWKIIRTLISLSPTHSHRPSAWEPLFYSLVPRCPRGWDAAAQCWLISLSRMPSRLIHSGIAFSFLVRLEEWVQEICRITRWL